MTRDGLSKMNKKIKAIIAIITAIAGIGGGSFITFNYTSIGDTNIINQILPKEWTNEVVLDVICNLDLIPTNYEKKCEEWNRNR